MRHLFTSAICLTALATAALANTQLADIGASAGKLQKGSEQVTLLLKEKQPDAQAIRDGITAMRGSIESLQLQVVGLTDANPPFIQRGDKDWDRLKMQVQLLSIFYNAKEELMKADDMKKNRSLLQAQAKGLATRAEALQETAQRLQR